MDNKKTTYIYIMCYFDGFIYEVEKPENLEIAEILDKYDFNEDECHYMVTTRKIDNIIPLK